MPRRAGGSSPRYLAGSHWLHFLQGTSPCPGSHLYRPGGEREELEKRKKCNDVKSNEHLPSAAYWQQAAPDLTLGNVRQH